MIYSHIILTLNLLHNHCTLYLKRIYMSMCYRQFNPAMWHNVIFFLRMPSLTQHLAKSSNTDFSSQIQISIHLSSNEIRRKTNAFMLCHIFLYTYLGVLYIMRWKCSHTCMLYKQNNSRYMEYRHVIMHRVPQVSYGIKKVKTIQIFWSCDTWGCCI